MKIIVFHQPFPMGNYKLQEKISNELSKEHDVYLLEQLNGNKPTNEYIEQIKEIQPDAFYFEMLDVETFDMLSKHFKDVLKVLCYSSPGILSDSDIELFSYYGLWYDKILTNSKQIHESCKRRNIDSEFFEFYISVIDDITPMKEYAHSTVFLGMGFNRITSDSYKLERDICFNNPMSDKVDFAIYGNGWNGHPKYKGVLHPNHIGNLYASSACAFALIAPSQRNMNMINNRYVEIAMSGCIILSPRYNIDWYGLDNYLIRVDDENDFILSSTIWSTSFKNEKLKEEYYNPKICLQQKFMEEKSSVFIEKLKFFL